MLRINSKRDLFVVSWLDSFVPVALQFVHANHCLSVVEAHLHLLTNIVNRCKWRDALAMFVIEDPLLNCCRITWQSSSRISTTSGILSFITAYHWCNLRLELLHSLLLHWEICDLASMLLPFDDVHCSLLCSNDYCDCLACEFIARTHCMYV